MTASPPSPAAFILPTSGFPMQRPVAAVGRAQRQQVTTCSSKLIPNLIGVFEFSPAQEQRLLNYRREQHDDQSPFGGGARLEPRCLARVGATRACEQSPAGQADACRSKLE